MISFSIDGHVYTGPFMPWSVGANVAASTIAGILGDDRLTSDIMAALRSDDSPDIVPILMRVIPRVPAMVMQWLQTMSRDGTPCTDESLAGCGLEPVVAAVKVAMLHGFFSPSSGLRAAFSETLPALAMTADALKDKADGATASQDTTTVHG